MVQVLLSAPTTDDIEVIKKLVMTILRYNSMNCTWHKMDVTTTAESVEFVAHNLISSLASRDSQPFA